MNPNFRTENTTAAELYRRAADWVMVSLHDFDRALALLAGRPEELGVRAARAEAKAMEDALRRKAKE